jgi:hypothetical protein
MVTGPARRSCARRAVRGAAGGGGARPCGGCLAGGTGPPARAAPPPPAFRAPRGAARANGWDETCPVSTEGGTRRVQSVREGGGRGAARARRSAPCAACRTARAPRSSCPCRPAPPAQKITNHRHGLSRAARAPAPQRAQPARAAAGPGGAGRGGALLVGLRVVSGDGLKLGRRRRAQHLPRGAAAHRAGATRSRVSPAKSRHAHAPRFEWRGGDMCVRFVPDGGGKCIRFVPDGGDMRVRLVPGGKGERGALNAPPSSQGSRGGRRPRPCRAPPRVTRPVPQPYSE